MRGMKWAIGAVAVLFAAVNLSRAADGETYDLRGPAPKAQVEFESTGREIKLIVTCAGGVPQATTRDEVGGH